MLRAVQDKPPKITRLPHQPTSLPAYLPTYVHTYTQEQSLPMDPLHLLCSPRKGAGRRKAVASKNSSVRVPPTL